MRAGAHSRLVLPFSILAGVLPLRAQEDRSFGREAIRQPRRSGVVEVDPALALLNAPTPFRLIQPMFLPNNVRVNQDDSGAPQNETTIATNPLNSDNLVGGANDYRFSAEEDVKAGYFYSFDGGFTWSDGVLPEPLFEAQGDPAVAVDADGNFYYSFISFNRSDDEGGLFVAKSTTGGGTWETPVPIVVHSTPGQPFEDKEYIAADATDSPYQNSVYVSWTRFAAGTSIFFSRSAGGGETYSEPMSISDAGSVQGSVPAVGPDGEVYVAWLHFGTSSIKLDRSFDGGETFGSDITVTTVNIIPSPLPPTLFRDNSFPTMAVDRSGGPYHGNIYIAWANNPSGPDDADILFVRSTDGGTSWSGLIQLNDDDTQNDQFFPWISVDSEGVISAIWYDRRLDPGDVFIDVYAAQSIDGGITFSANERVTTVSFDPNIGFGGAFIGDYNGLASAPGRIFPLWTDTRLGEQDIFTAPSSVTFIVTPQLLDFGAVSPGDTALRDVVLRNLGTDTVTVSDIEVSPEVFGVTEASFEIAPGDSHIVVVSFAPESAGFYPGLLAFFTDIPGRPEIYVTLWGRGGSLGDLDGDGDVDIVDIVRAISITLGSAGETTEYELWAADVNADGLINIFDIILIVQLALEFSLASG